MELKQVTGKLRDSFAELFGKPVKVVGIKSGASGWIAQVEVIEEDEYMTRFARNQLIGTYEVELGFEGEILGYKRIHMRERGDLVTSDLSE